MNCRERFIACMLGQKVDRAPFWLFWGEWPDTWRRWHAEGAPEHFKSHYDLQRHFEADLVPGILPINCGPCPRRDWITLQEDEHSITRLDAWGVTRRDLKGRTTMAQFLDFPIKSHSDWIAYREKWLNPDDPRRLEGPWRQRAAEWTAQGRPIQIGYACDTGMYGAVRWLLGDEECLLAFIAQPDLIADIMNHMTDVILAVYEKVAAEVRIDMIHWWEDFCGRQGPLISPAHFRQFIGPCYGRVKDFADRHEIPVISVDTDGQPDLAIAPMMEGGVNFIFPFEVAAGCDVRQVRRKYPHLGMLGGIDKRALAAGKEAIDAELARVAPVISSNRYIADLDHQVPPDVSWENFCYYAKRLKETILAAKVR